MRKRSLIFLSLATVVAIAGFLLVLRTNSPDKLQPVSAPQERAEPARPLSGQENQESAQALVKESTFSASDVPGAASAFDFSATIPSTWRIEAVPANEALNIYDPAASGANTLEKSQLFIRHFSANDFLTLSTVTIWNVEDLKIGERPAREYQIVKKPGVPPFPHQPSWRNEEHTVTDIRASDTNPSTFYVIGQRPGLSQEILEKFFQNFEVASAAADDIALVEPVDEFKNRITKKPFGILITPETSPVQPERFSGYHTGVDVEYDDIVSTVPVLAIANGSVLRAQTASGYGGVLVIEHSINGEPHTVVYGHLDPDSLPAVGTRVLAGQTVGHLGQGGTFETDGERKHLHFAIKPGSDVDLRGYVSTENELREWLNPADIL